MFSIYGMILIFPRYVEREGFKGCFKKDVYPIMYPTKNHLQ